MDGSKLGYLGLALLMGQSVGAMTETHLCKRGSAIRRVEVVYEDGEKKLPCKVKYQKGEAPAQELYSAQNELGFCEKKASEFAEKLTQERWACALGDVTAESAGMPPENTADAKK